MLTSAYDQRQSHHRKEMSQQERFNEIAGPDLRMSVEGLFDWFSRQKRLPELYPHLQALFEDIAVVPMDDPHCQLTADAWGIVKVYKMAWAKAEEYERKGEAA